MNCNECQPLLGPYADGELDLVTTLDVERHIHLCQACGRASRALAALRTVLTTSGSSNGNGSPPLYFRAPESLRAQIVGQLPVGRIAPAKAALRRRWPMWSAAAAAMVALVGTLAVMLVQQHQPKANPDLAIAQEVIAGHVRSLMANHLYDVESNDKHNVKPWFHGKLDFAPDVQQYDEQAFPLKGGRLDYLAGRPVAALVYGHAKHSINLFTWPAAKDAPETGPTYENRQGYAIAHWVHSGMQYWAVSDTAQTTLQQFVERVTAVQSACHQPE